MSLIECVPNVSEGRRCEVVDGIADALRGAGSVRLLDYSSDPSHNRSVFTLVGDTVGLTESILALFARAVAEIDMRTHRGVHPRVGAVDVVPFIPLAGATMADCVALARSVGASVAERFQVPVYLYEAASDNPARKNLEDIRRGQFEQLAAKMAAPLWVPDFGPSRPHPTAGATIIGARMPLIAYNINLATDRLDVAARIAATIRQSGGGLPCVKAIGVALAERGIVQVSMNLTNYERTSMDVVFDAVEREAGKYGVTVVESQIIGLVPSAALNGTTAEQLRLAHFSEQQILETHLRK